METTMKRFRSLAVLVLVCTALVGAGKAIKPAGYDPKRDPAADLKAAMTAAQRDGKRILLEVGGEWCPWCHILNDLFTEDKEVSARLHDNYVVVKVNFSREVKNEAFLSQYPTINTYPHMYVLENDGKLLHADDLSTMELKDGYDRAKVLNFLTYWAPKPNGKAR
jgi:thioredoxin-related protein